MRPEDEQPPSTRPPATPAPTGPRSAGRARSAPPRRAAAAPAGPRRRRARRAPGRGGHRPRRRVHAAAGPPRHPRRGRRRQRAVPADRAARVQRRRRRRGRDLAGRHAVLPGADRPGPRPGGAVPGPDDAAVRDRGAADRAVPRPVQPRPPLGDRRDDGAARRSCAGCSPTPYVRRLGGAVPRGARLPGGVEGVRRHPGRRRPAGAARPAQPGQGQLPDLAGRRRRRRDLGAAGRRGPRRSGRSGRCATRSWSSSAARSWRSCCPPSVDSSAGEDASSLPRVGRQKPKRPPVPHSVVVALRAQHRAAAARGLPDDVHGVPAARQAVPRLGGPAGAAARPGDRRPPGSAAPSASPSARCCAAISPQVTVVVALLADAAVAVVVALFYGLPTAVLLGLTAGLAQSLGKLSLDALIQREIPERTPGRHVRPVRDPAAAVLGGRRVHRHRPAAGPQRRPRRRRRDPGRVVRLDAGGGAREATRAARTSSSELELVGERAQHLRGRLGDLGVGVPAGAVGPARCSRAAGRGPR